MMRSRTFFRYGSMLAAVVVTVVLAGSPAGAEPIVVTSKPVLLNPNDPEQRVVDDLIYRGGLELKSENARFGGLSGLLVDAAGKGFTAVTDRGSLITGTLDYDGAGDLVGVSEVDLSPLIGTDGKPLTDKTEVDAESLALDGTGGLLVAFEHKHRIWRYPLGGGAPEVIQPPRELHLAPSNDGIEALTRLTDGTLLAISEGFQAGGMSGLGVVTWVGDGEFWSILSYAMIPRYAPTAATTLDNGDVLVLERQFSMATGAVVRVRRLDVAKVQPAAHVQTDRVADLFPPLTVENFEGLASRTGPKGESLLYMVSDDNFHVLQRTLLLMFEMRR